MAGVTRADLVADLAAIGLAEGDTVLVHAALRRIGPMIGGPDILIAALRDVLGPSGTVLGYCDWIFEDDWCRPEWREHVLPFDPAASRATRDNGFFPEMLRTTPGALRSANPGASMAALGGRAAWITADHALDYGYGPQSPLAKLVEVEGKVLMLGAPWDKMTLLHHAEHLADFPHKRIKRYETPILVEGTTQWRWFEEFDTSHSPDGVAEDYFATIAGEFVAAGGGRRGKIGHADSLLVPAAPMVRFAIAWMERRLGRTASQAG